MQQLTAHDITVLFLSLGILLGTARLMGELAQRLHQPAVLGELLAGVLLGPTVLGTLAPAFSAFLFPAQGPSAIALNAITTLAIALFLMVAGIEVDLSTIWRQGKVGAKIGLASIAVPFLCGLAAAWLAPAALGRRPDADPLIFMLFVAIALSISALPVIAKTLMDMDLYRSDLGMVVISAAILNDLVGWIIFAVVLGMLGHADGNGNAIVMTITLTLAFSAAMLTLGRWLIHKTLPFVPGLHPLAGRRAASPSPWPCWARPSPNGSASTPSSARFWWGLPWATRPTCANARASPSSTSSRRSSPRSFSPASGCTSIFGPISTAPWC